jgi:hypothetical protein
VDSASIFSLSESRLLHVKLFQTARRRKSRSIVEIIVALIQKIAAFNLSR